MAKKIPADSYSAPLAAPLDSHVKAITRQLWLACGENKSQTARILDVSLRTVRNILNKRQKWGRR